MLNDQNQQRRTNPHPAREPLHCEPPGWLSTEDLEQELLCAAVVDSRSLQPEDRFERLDAYFAADFDEAERQYRRSLLVLLADFRPLLAELLGGPRDL